MTLTQPIDLYGTIHNRVVFQPMEGADGNADGSIGDLTHRRYLRFAESAAGILWFEAVAVCPEGRANPRQLYLTQENLESFRTLIREVKETSLKRFGFAPKLIVQLTHSGRQSRAADGTPKPIVAYRSKFLEQGKESLHYEVATDEYLSTIPQLYAQSAALAVEAGFDGIDVKNCHGYLFNELLSAYGRQGLYGGSLENRTRLYFNCIDAVRGVVPDQCFVTTRLNASDCYPYPNGYGISQDNTVDLSECKQILKTLSQKGISLVNITLGNPYMIPHINRPYYCAEEKIEQGLARFRSVMQELSKVKGIELIASALTASAERCIEYGNQMLEEGLCSFVGFGRMTFAYPQFFKDYLETGTIQKNKCCVLCGKCTQLMRKEAPTGCPVRDREVYAPIYQKYVLQQEIKP